MTDSVKLDAALRMMMEAMSGSPAVDTTASNRAPERVEAYYVPKVPRQLKLDSRSSILQQEHIQVLLKWRDDLNKEIEAKLAAAVRHPAASAKRGNLTGQARSAALRKWLVEQEIERRTKSGEVVRHG
ncbi:MAG TPA: hypothetical protein VM223_06200 [Planctomycetota bacterium]|nr:hypothetical protein [Planctomycetota bacterium]